LFHEAGKYIFPSENANISSKVYVQFNPVQEMKGRGICRATEARGPAHQAGGIAKEAGPMRSGL